MPVRFIGKFSDNHFMIGSGIEMPEGDTYVATFDFDATVMNQLQGKIPDKAMAILREPFDDRIHNLQFADATYFVTVDSKVGDKLAENEDEIFLPLWINRIIG